MDFLSLSHVRRLGMETKRKEDDEEAALGTTLYVELVK